MNTIRTGVEDWCLTWDDDLLEKTELARRRVPDGVPSNRREARLLIAAGIPQLVVLAEDGRVSDEEFCER